MDRWNLTERQLDRMLGVDTSLTDRTWSNRFLHPCQPSPMAALEAMAARLTPGDRVVDYGCGAGRAMFALAHLARCGVTGVELDSRRMALARENLRRCARNHPDTAARVRLVQCAAQEYLPTAEETAFYFFNPFPATVLRGVLARIRRSAEASPRQVRLFCYYPDPDWLALLPELGFALAEDVSLRDRLGRDPRERLTVFRAES